MVVSLELYLIQITSISKAVFDLAYGKAIELSPLYSMISTNDMYIAVNMSPYEETTVGTSSLSTHQSIVCICLKT